MIRGLTIDVVTGSDPAVARAAFALWREIALRHIADMAKSPALAPTKTGKRRASR